MKKWTDDKTKVLKERWAEGIPSHIIGGELGFQGSTVRNKARKLGLPARLGGRQVHVKSPPTLCMRKYQPNLPDWLRQLWRLDLAKL